MNRESPRHTFETYQVFCWLASSNAFGYSSTQPMQEIRNKNCTALLDAKFTASRVLEAAAFSKRLRLRTLSVRSGLPLLSASSLKLLAHAARKGSVLKRFFGGLSSSGVWEDGSLGFWEDVRPLSHRNLTLLVHPPAYSVGSLCGL